MTHSNIVNPPIPTDNVNGGISPVLDGATFSLPIRNSPSPVLPTQSFMSIAAAGTTLTKPETASSSSTAVTRRLTAASKSPSAILRGPLQGSNRARRLAPKALPATQRNAVDGQSIPGYSCFPIYGDGDKRRFKERRAPYTPARKKQVKEVRDKGACIRCGLLKKRVSCLITALQLPELILDVLCSVPENGHAMSASNYRSQNKLLRLCGA